MFYRSGNKCQEIQGEGGCRTTENLWERKKKEGMRRDRVKNVHISCEMSDYRLYKLEAL